MSFMSKKKMPMVFSTTQAAEYMGISPNTLRRYARVLGLEARRMYHVRGRFYFFHEMVQMMQLRAPKARLFRHRVLDRYEEMRKEGLDKAAEPD
jgi:hypothetical protein